MATDTKESSTLALGEINKYNFRTDSPAVFKSRRGLDANIVTQISEMKREPAWMRDFRLKSLEIFNSRPMPHWGGDIGIDFQDIFYYLKPTDHQGKTWDDVPEEIKKTFDRLGIPEAERKFLSGVKAQFESEVVYGSLQEDLAKKGVIFTDTDTAIREHTDLLREYFGTIIPPTDNKFAESLHSAVVEVVVKKHGRCRYTTIQNWANNIYNLVTKRAVCREAATMEWVDGNLGSHLTMKYPSVWMTEPGAHGEILSIAFASAGQHQDAGAKLVHAAPHTSGRIVSKSISKNGGRASYRGLVKVMPGARKSKSSVVCDALILDDRSRSDTYPYIEVEEQDVSIGHEASVSKIGEEQLFYLTSRGLTEAEASTMIVGGFIEPLVKELPMEYAVEMNRLIELQMEGSVG